MKNAVLASAEGLNGIGKSTFCSQLLSTLRETGISVTLLKFPSLYHTSSYTSSYNEIYEILRTGEGVEKLVDLFYQNRLETLENINEIKQEYAVVILDRYVYSQAHYFYNVEDYFAQIDKEFLKLPVPDLVFYLSGSPYNIVDPDHQDAANMLFTAAYLHPKYGRGWRNLPKGNLTNVYNAAVDIAFKLSKADGKLMAFKLSKADGKIMADGEVVRLVFDK